MNAYDFETAAMHGDAGKIRALLAAGVDPCADSRDWPFIPFYTAVMFPHEAYPLTRERIPVLRTMWLATPSPDCYPCHGGFYHPLVGKTGAPESLGLPGFKTDSVKGRGMMKPINHKLAEVLIRGLIKLRAVDGDEVIFDGDVVNHRDGKDGSIAKTQGERKRG